MKAEMEVTKNKVSTMLMNVDIGEGGSGIADVRLPCENMEDLTYQTVDGRRLMIQVGVSVFVDNLFSRVNGGVIRFVINNQ